jgi:hypothetical protein
VRLIKDLRCHGAEPSITIERIQIFDILGRQLEIENAEILLDPRFRYRFRDSDNPSLDLITQKNLSRTLLVLLSELFQFGVIKQLGFLGFGPWSIGRSQWAVTRHCNTLRFAKFNQFALIEVRMALDLQLLFVATFYFPASRKLT